MTVVSSTPKSIETSPTTTVLVSAAAADVYKRQLLHVNIGYLSLLINLPLVLLAWKKVDRDFARKTLVFVLVFSAVTLVLGQMDLSAIAYDSGSSAILGPVAAGVISGAIDVYKRQS